MIPRVIMDINNLVKRDESLFEPHFYLYFWKKLSFEIVIFLKNNVV